MGALVVPHSAPAVTAPDALHGTQFGSRADAWFSALDHSMLVVGPETWLVQVLGIHDTREGLWIQVSSIEEPDQGFVLHVDGRTSIGDVLAALRTLPEVPRALTIIRPDRTGR